MSNRLVTIVALFVALSISSGCGVVHDLGKLGAHPKSFDSKGERVELRLLNAQALTSDPKIANHYAPPATQKALAAAPAASLIAGLVVDFVKGQLEKEANRYEAQWNASLFTSPFWFFDKSQGQYVFPYAGFELRRDTDAGSEPAFRLICALEPVQNNRMIVVKPLYLRVERSKAKVAFPKNKVSIGVKMLQEGKWVDEKNTLHQQEVSQFEWTASGVKLGSETYYNGNMAASPNKTQVLAGTLIGLPLGPEASGKLAAIDKAAAGGPKDAAKQDAEDKVPGDGMMVLTAQVTEKDESAAKQYIEKAAKFVGDKKSAVVDYVKQKTGGGSDAGAGGSNTGGNAGGGTP